MPRWYDAQDQFVKNEDQIGDIQKAIEFSRIAETHVGFLFLT